MPNGYIQESKSANDFRNNGKFQEAIAIYTKLWEQKEDMYVGCGLLHCLRKLGSTAEALKFSEKLINKYPNFSWAKNEYIWTQIQCGIDSLDPEKDFNSILTTATNLLSLELEPLALNHIAFKVLKSAKHSGNWDILNEWVDKITPNTLQDTPMVSEEGKEGWSWKGLWFNYKIAGLIHAKHYDKALTDIDVALSLFPRQKKFFLRSKALVFNGQQRLEESKNIYENLCNNPKADWWIRTEYAQALISSNNNDDALKQLCLACNSRVPRKSLVNAFAELGKLLFRQQNYADSSAHFALCKYVRLENSWSIPSDIEAALHKLENTHHCHPPASLHEALTACSNVWVAFLKKNVTALNSRQNIKGKIEGLLDTRPYCFIRAMTGETFFCSKKLLPTDTNNGSEVVFDAAESFDKKKNKKSWVAITVKR